ncbi:MAG: DUF1552 domain-containing protein [Pirellulales bacterium]
MSSSQPQSRRTFLARAALQGPGVAVALPLLESVGWANHSATPDIPQRMAFLYLPNGVRVDTWMPKQDVAGYQLGTALEPLAPHQPKLSFVTGLAHRNGFAGPDGAGDHARATATFLTATRPLKTAGANLKAGISADQLAAQQLGHQTRFPSLELSCDGVRKSGNCDSGYSCAYQFNLAWRTARQPATPESNPRLVFERLFGQGSGPERKASWQAQQQSRRSILDFVLEEARSFRGGLAVADRHKLDEYLTGIRDLEARLIRFEHSDPPDAPDLDLPEKQPAVYSEHIRLMGDMLALAFQTDSTRVATFLLAHDGSNRSFPEIGVGDGHHALSHHRDDREKIEKIGKIDRFYAEQFAYLLGRLDAMTQPDGRSLLDHSMIVYAGGLSDGNRHRHDNLPVAIAGSAGGRLKTGQLFNLPDEKPMANLLLTMLDTFGIETDSFGDSTGRLDMLRS